MELVLASGNRHKLEEIRSVLESVTIRSSQEFSAVPREIEETGSTLDENALLKVKIVFSLVNLPTIADDTGLEVRALNGAPGVYSARYAGEGCTFRDNIEKLLRELSGTENRRARFRTVIAFIDGGKEYLFEGRCEGLITLAPRGEQGFGYDAVFQPEGSTKTFAEMTMEEKNSVSHRAQALQKLSKFILHHTK